MNNVSLTRTEMKGLTALPVEYLEESRLRQNSRKSWNGINRF